MTRRPPRKHRANSSIAVSLVLFTAFAVVVLGAVWAAQKSQSGVPLRSTYELEVAMKDLAGLSPHSEVRQAGKRVGQVLDPKLVDGSPHVRLQLDPDVGPLPADSRFVVRSKGLLGGRFLEIDAGRSSDRLADGATVAARQTSSTVDVPELLNSFPPERRQDARTIVDAAGTGFLGRGQGLNDTIADGTRVLTDLGSLSSAVTARPGAVRALVPSLQSAVGSVDAVRDPIASGFEPAADALRPFSDEADRLRQTLDVAPAALEAARSGLRRTDPLLVQVTGVSRSARTLLRPAPAALRDVRGLLHEAPANLARADVLLRDVPAAVDETVALRRPLEAELPRVDATLDSTSPIGTALSSHTCDIRHWAENWSSMLRNGRPGGGEVGPLTALRLELIVSPSNSVQGLTSERGFTRDPYPATCAQRGER